MSLRWFLVCWAAFFAWIVWTLFDAPEPPHHARTDLKIAWLTELPDPGSIMASPLIDGESLWITAIEDNGTFRAAGSVQRLDLKTGKVVFRWDNDGKMLHSIGSPTKVGSRIFVGEGMHANSFCGLSAFDAVSGKTQWRYPVNSHIEGAAVSDGTRIVFPAGDDGLVCLNLDGTKKWHYSNRLHFDAAAIITPEAVIAGSAISRACPEAAVVWLDPETGGELQRMPSTLSVWNLLVDGERVIASCGNGKLLMTAKEAIGEWLAFDRKTGRRLWETPCSDTLISPGVVVDGVLTAGSRDGYLFWLDVADGTIRRRDTLLSPILSSPLRYRDGFIVVTETGKVWQMRDGLSRLRLDLRIELEAGMVVAGSPKLDPFGRIIVVAEIQHGGRSSAGVFALEEVP